MAKNNYYSLINILKEKATYNIIIGERSNGKTYAVEEFGLKNYCESGFISQMAIIRRWADDFKGKRGEQMFEALVANGTVKKYSKGKYTTIVYKSARWYLANYDTQLEKYILAEQPFAYAFSLSAMEHDKSTAYPNIKTILFDEFLTRRLYLNDEFILFMNVLSTIIRDREGIKIFMCGNTVNKYCPYFIEMGITNIETMKQGDIDIYTYGETGLKVAVEYCSNRNGKKSDTYFAFNNPKLKMITSGEWEINIYPHLPHRYKPKNIKLTYFIEFNRTIIQGEIIQIKIGDRNHRFTYLHRKTTELRDLKKDRIYKPEYSSSPNHRRFINKPIDDVDKLIYSFFIEDKVFYQDNELGEVVRNYLNWCKSDRGFA